MIPLTVKIDKVDMYVERLLHNVCCNMAVDSVLLTDGSVYIFSDYTVIEFNGYSFQMGNKIENRMFESMFSTIQAIAEL